MKHINIMVLIALVTFIAGCSVFNEPLAPQNTDGLAQVRVYIGSNARTILPNFDGVFSKYELSVEPVSGNNQNSPPPVERSGDGNWVTIGVPIGEWIITVTAYVKVSDTDYASATGSAYLEVWGDTHVNVTLNMPETGGTGTFAYTVAYPTSASAQIKLEPWPLEDKAAVLNNTSVNNGVLASQSVASGIYFLTVTATKSERTVIRNEIVHIYRGLTTNANYVFTKLDFGNESLRIEGTVNVLLDGQQPDDARVYIYSSDNSYIGGGSIFFPDTDGNGTWFADIDNLRGTDTLYFRVSAFGFLETDVLHSIPVPIDNITDINLGTATFNATALSANTWVNGNITNPYAFDFYYVQVSEGQEYYLWWNDTDNGGGTVDIRVAASYSNREEIFDVDNWESNAESFQSTSTGIVIIAVYTLSETTGTYAITYSTTSVRPD